MRDGDVWRAKVININVAVLAFNLHIYHLFLYDFLYRYRRLLLPACYRCFNVTEHLLYMGSMCFDALLGG
jgi:hypothetical protein